MSLDTPGAAPRPRAYVAGPLFDEGERWWIERVEQTVAAAGFTTFLPHRDNPPKDEHNVADIFANDRRGIDQCDVVVASLNGITTDDGTAWELGYAFALGKPIVGLHTDWRRRFDHEVINLMIECSLTLLVRSIDDLPNALRSVVDAGTAASASTTAAASGSTAAGPSGRSDS